MAKQKKPLANCRLELAGPLAGCRTDRSTYEVRGGRWVRPDGNVIGECVVIAQERQKGPLGQGSVFRMAIEREAVELIVDGLRIWLATQRKGRPSRLFKGPANS